MLPRNRYPPAIPSGKATSKINQIKH